MKRRLFLGGLVLAVLVLAAAGLALRGADALVRTVTRKGTTPCSTRPA